MEALSLSESLSLPPSPLRRLVCASAECGKLCALHARARLQYAPVTRPLRVRAGRGGAGGGHLGRPRRRRRGGAGEGAVEPTAMESGPRAEMPHAPPAAGPALARKGANGVSLVYDTMLGGRGRGFGTSLDPKKRGLSPVGLNRLSARGPSASPAPAFVVEQRAQADVGTRRRFHRPRRVRSGRPGTPADSIRRLLLSACSGRRKGREKCPADWSQREIMR